MVLRSYVRVALPFFGALCLLHSTAARAEPVTVADASLSAAFYSDSSCLLTIDTSVEVGKTVIDANVGDGGSRMLIHCDTSSGRRLTLLAKGDALNVSQKVTLLNREQITEGESGMIAWLTRSGVTYVDDKAPRRYVVAGGVLLRKSPPAEVAGAGLNSLRQPFARISGLLEPILKSNSQPVSNTSDQSDASSGSSDQAPSSTSEPGSDSSS